MIRIGVLSDTHLGDTGQAAAFLHMLAIGHFSGVDMILHAGDVVAPALLATFAPCPVYAVRGNMDPSDQALPHKRVLEVNGLRIGLIHGWGPPEGLVERICREFRDIPLDCLVFGHSHAPLCQEHNGMLLFNPGSATDRRKAVCESIGLLEVDAGKVSGRIIPLETVERACGPVAVNR